MPFPGGPVLRTVGLEEIILVSVSFFCFFLFFCFLKFIFLLDLGDGSVESKMVLKLSFLIRYLLYFCASVTIQNPI